MRTVAIALLGLNLIASSLFVGDARTAAVPGADDVSRYVAVKAAPREKTILRDSTGRTVGTASTVGTRTTFRDPGGGMTGAAAVEGNRTLFRDAPVASWARQRRQVPRPPIAMHPSAFDPHQRTSAGRRLFPIPVVARLLFYDVSRWGRFQDADESAYYEFICGSATGAGSSKMTRATLVRVISVVSPAHRNRK